MRTKALISVGLLCALCVPTLARDDGVQVGNPSFLRKLVSAQRVEEAAFLQFKQLKGQAQAKQALLPPDHPQNVRLRRIARDLLPHAEKWNPRAKEWRWEVITLNSRNINAFCMPGGKIAFFTGILEQLSLSDDEAAMIMGHEMAHALREHARERAAKTTLTNLTGRIVGTLLFGQAGDILGAAGSNLLTLKFSRDDEREADLVGMEMAARAGYDPASGITLWEKMSAAARASPPQWMSSHPATETRIALIKEHLKDVQPLYEKARAAKADGKLPPTLRKEEGEQPPLPTTPNSPTASRRIPNQLPPPGPSF